MGGKRSPYQFFFCNFHTGIKFQDQCKSQIDDLEPRAFLEKIGFSRQIFIKLKLS